MKTYAISNYKPSIGTTSFNTANTVAQSAVTFTGEKVNAPHHAPRATGLKAMLLAIAASLGLAGCEGPDGLGIEKNIIDNCTTTDAGVPARYGGLPKSRLTTDAGAANAIELIQRSLENVPKAIVKNM